MSDDESEPKIDVSKLDPKIITKIFEAEKALRELENTAILFLYQNPVPMFVRHYNAMRQAEMEVLFSPACSENPEVRKEKLRGYTC